MRLTALSPLWRRQTQLMKKVQPNALRMGPEASEIDFKERIEVFDLLTLEERKIR